MRVGWRARGVSRSDAHTLQNLRGVSRTAHRRSHANVHCACVHQIARAVTHAHCVRIRRINRTRCTKRTCASALTRHNATLSKSCYNKTVDFLTRRTFSGRVGLREGVGCMRGQGHRPTPQISALVHPPTWKDPSYTADCTSSVHQKSSRLLKNEVTS